MIGMVKAGKLPEECSISTEPLSSFSKGKYAKTKTTASRKWVFRGKGDRDQGLHPISLVNERLPRLSRCMYMAVITFSTQTNFCNFHFPCRAISDVGIGEIRGYEKCGKHSNGVNAHPGNFCAHFFTSQCRHSFF